MPRTVLVLGVVTAVVGAPAAAGEFVPFVIPADWSDKAEINFSSPAIAVDSPRIVVRDGHFRLAGRAGKRIRIWGVNLCFGACFPAHKDAGRVAARMAAFGINSVRFHHMDMGAFPRGIWDPKDPMRLSGEALDRLDYFIDQLARKGIWANVNLHVSRTHSRCLKLPDPGGGLKYDKMVGLFTPALIEAQKKYARDLLTHVNKYRKVRYAADPAIAFIEITNEDSFFMWGWEGKLRRLPEFYAKILHGKYAAWLKQRYGTTAKLRAAWGAGGRPLGKNMLPVMRLAPTPGDARAWRLEQHGGCEATVALLGRTSGVRIEIRKADRTGWHIQFNLGGVAVKKGKYYTLTFRARADKARRIGFNIGQAHEPWRMLGLSRNVQLTTAWRNFRAGFAATASDDNARVNFQAGGSNVAVELADVQLRPGGRQGLQDRESIETASVVLFAESETPARTLDRMRFLAETEKGYFDSMRAYVKKDLACGALVTGTVVFGPLGLWAQSGMDYVDAHAYWHHPRFGGRAWDPGNWTVEQEAMVDKPERSTLFRLAASRLAGKPFTVSEYNHPAPNDYQAECVPTITAFGAAQDWDGIWLFAYSHRSDAWDRQYFSSFFDIQANPAKWGFVPAGTAIFREGGIRPLWEGTVVSIPDSEHYLADAARLHLGIGRDLFARIRQVATADLGELVARRWAVSRFGPTRAMPKSGAEPPCPILDWSPGSLFAWGPGAFVAVGHAEMLQQRAIGAGMGVAKADLVAITQTPLDGRPKKDSRKVLITVCARGENTDMKFSADRRTVGRAWGKAPVRIEAPEVNLSILAGDGKTRWRCHALGPDGKPTVEVPVQYHPGSISTVKLSPEHRTMWFLLTREKK